MISPLDAMFSGFAQDVSRDQLGKGMLWRMADLIPNLGAPARKRGGWTYQDPAVGGSYISGLGYFRKTTGVTEQLVVVNNTGQVTVSGAVKGIVGLTGVKHNPFYFLGNLILPSTNYAAKKWDGATLTVSKTGFNVGCAWGDFIVWGSGTSDATLINFGVTTTTTIAGSTVNMPGEVVALAGLPGRMVLVWGYSDTWALFGDNPPPGGNMQQRTLYAGNGIMDQRSLVNTGAYVIWANTTGIYQSSGSEGIPLDLTERGGISTFWRNAVSGFNLSAGWAAAATAFKNFYLISITDASRNPVVTLLCDLETGKWIELQNVSARAFVRAPGASSSSEEAYFGRTQEPRVGKLSTLWTPGAPALAYDGDGTPVLPYLETAFYRVNGFQEDRIRTLYPSYALVSTVGNSRVDASFVLSPEETTYVQAAASMPLLPKQDRLPVPIRARARGLAAKLALHSAADDFALYGLEVEAHGGFEKR